MLLWNILSTVKSAACCYLNTLADVEDFYQPPTKARKHNCSPSLTEGVHLHTLEASNGSAIEEAEDRLHRLGILLPTGN